MRVSDSPPPPGPPRHDVKMTIVESRPVKITSCVCFFPLNFLFFYPFYRKCHERFKDRKSGKRKNVAAFAHTRAREPCASGVGVGRGGGEEGAQRPCKAGT